MEVWWGMGKVDIFCSLWNKEGSTRGDREGNFKKEVERVSFVELKNLELRIGEVKLEDVI